MSVQDLLGISGDLLGTWHCRAGKSECQIWGKPLYDGSWVAGLYNADSNRHSITLDFSLLKMQGMKANVRDLWQHKDLGAFAGDFFVLVNGLTGLTGNFTAHDIPPHATVVVKVTPTHA